MRENNYFLIPFEFCNECEHMLSVNFLYNFSCKECYNLAGRIFIRLDFVWEHFVDYSSSLLSTCLIYVTTTSTRIPLNMSVSLVHFTAFIWVQNTQASRSNSLDYRTVICGGKMCYAVTSHIRRVVFLVMSIPQLLAKESYNILSNSLHEKLYKKFTDNICSHSWHNSNGIRK